MSLTKEKESIFAKTQNSKINFSQIDKAADTYYIPYEASKHTGSVIMEYSSDIPVLRSEITKLWKDSSLEEYTGDVLSAIFKCKDNEDSVLEAIELFNYMM